MPALSKGDKQVLGSLFRLGGQQRHNISWTEFVQAMTNLGFAYAPSGKKSGSGRTFTAPAALGGGSAKFDEPHGKRSKRLQPKDQAAIARRLDDHFDLGTAVKQMLAPPPAEAPAEEPVEEPAEEPVEEPAEELVEEPAGQPA